MSEFVYEPLDETNVDMHEAPGTGTIHRVGCHTLVSNEIKALGNMGTDSEGMVDQINEILDIIQPYLKLDNGSIRISSLKKGNLVLRLTGDCGSCGSIEELKNTVESSLREEVEGIGNIFWV
jgi:Fe-S cluster biogenesis protein NfuA